MNILFCLNIGDFNSIFKEKSDHKKNYDFFVILFGLNSEKNTDSKCINFFELIQNHNFTNFNYNLSLQTQKRLNYFGLDMLNNMNNKNHKLVSLFLNKDLILKNLTEHEFNYLIFSNQLRRYNLDQVFNYYNFQNEEKVNLFIPAGGIGIDFFYFYNLHKNIEFVLNDKKIEFLNIARKMLNFSTKVRFDNKMLLDFEFNEKFNVIFISHFLCLMERSLRRSFLIKCIKNLKKNGLLIIQEITRKTINEYSDKDILDNEEILNFPYQDKWNIFESEKTVDYEKNDPLKIKDTEDYKNKFIVFYD